MNIPTGTITFLFTDIEGSTKLWERCPEAMRHALARHDLILRVAIERHEGYVFKTVGDAFCAAFPTAPDALMAALDAHLALLEQEWGETGTIRVRMGLHTGEAEEGDNDYFGQTVNRVARLQAIAFGAQTLLSQATFELVRDRLPDRVQLQPMGLHRLKDLNRAEQVFQVVHPDLPAQFPPLRSLDNLPNNLPVQLTSFVGRQREMADVKSLLHVHPLVTLIGPGGTGKTRLSLQVGADLLEQYLDGVWLVELAPLSDPSLVAHTVADVLGVREAPAEPITRTLIAALKEKQMLLVLDNCEHVLDASARLVDAVLKSCPKMRVLTSSREALGIAGEHTYRVPSLSLPDKKQFQTPESLSHHEAARLFIERAIAVKGNFTVTNQNAPALASVCHRLDGIPLAIELAAARVRGMSIEQIEARLDNRFRLLTGGSRTALPRQQTLKALIDWSYDLLKEQEKTLFQRLAAFAGGWTLEAAEKVCSGEGIEDSEVIDLLLSLVDKSLVVYEEQAGQARYRLLETIGQYAHEKLVGGGEAERLRQRHQEFYLALAEESEPLLRGPEQSVCLHRLETEHDNLRAALQGEDKETSLRIAVLVWWFWYIRGHVNEGRARLEEALRQAGEGVETATRAKALHVAGNLATVQDDYDSARLLYAQSLEMNQKLGHRQGSADTLRELGNLSRNQSDYRSARMVCEQSLAIYRELGDKGGIATSLDALARVASSQGDYTYTRTLYGESLTIRRELGDKGKIADSLTNLGHLAMHEADYPSARTFYEESLVIKRELGDKRTVAITLMNLGNVANSQGDYNSARTLHNESLAIITELGDKWLIAQSLNCRGNLAKDQCDYESARSHYQEGQAMFAELGDKGGVAHVLGCLADVSRCQGDYSSARRLCQENLAIRKVLGPQHKLGIATGLECLVAVDAAQGLPERAAQLLGAAERLREEISAPLSPNERKETDRNRSTAHQALGEEAFSAAWAAGRAMTLEQAIDYAMEKTGS